MLWFHLFVGLHLFVVGWNGSYTNPCILTNCSHWTQKTPRDLIYGLKILKEILYDQQNQTSCSHFAGIMQTQLESELDWPLPWGGSSPQQSRVVANIFPIIPQLYKNKAPFLHLIILLFPHPAPLKPFSQLQFLVYLSQLGVFRTQVAEISVSFPQFWWENKNGK